ncbi:hypothetical protein LCGC14_0527460 [marine sediment metagenome]|uniref:Portal protein n=1 Tax=marine sediment metagenome TaxID=412755 RepID=A0A0F9RWU5_9ZZZZ
MPNFKDLVSEKEAEFWDLTRRMDGDKDLLYLKDYIMRDKDKKIVPDIINITLPDIAIFAAEILSRLGEAVERIIVTSENKGLDTAFIEDFQRTAFASADDRRRRQGLPGVNIHADEQVCIRGRGARRVLFRTKNDTLITDITPWDTRFVTYDYDEEGLKWAAYKTERTKAMIEADFGIIIKGKEATVMDAWDKEHNEVWIDNSQFRSVDGFIPSEQEHPYGFTPVAIEVVSLGSMLADEDNVEHTGESLFFLIRDLIPELFRLVSIAQTINMRLAKGAILYKNEGGSNTEPPDNDDVTGIGASTAIGINEKIEKVDIQDIQRSFTELTAIIETRLQRGSISNVDLGILGGTPPSGVTLLAAKTERDTVYRPRTKAKALLNETTAEMFTKQVIQIGGTVELGVPGQKRKFDTSKLKGEYQTEYKYFVKSPELDAGSFTLNAAAGDSIAKRFKDRDILQLEDPDENDQWLSWERLGRTVPAVQMNRDIRNTIKLAEKGVEGAEIEAEIASAAMGVSLEAMLAGDIDQIPTPEEEQEPKQVVPLLGQQGGAVAPRSENAT